MIRLALAGLFIVLFLIVSLPFQLVVWLLSKKWPKAPDHISYAMVCWAFKVVMFISGVKLEVRGRENIPQDQAVMYVGNHRGMFDIVTTYTLVTRPAGFLSKDSFKKVPGLSWWMSLMHCVFLDRNDIKQGLQCILKCIDMIKNDISVVVFPEGTRSQIPDDFLEFHEGTFKIASKTGCQIVPMVINNTNAVFEDHFPSIKPAKIIVEFLEPFTVNDLEPDQKKTVGAYTRAMILEKYRANMAEI